MPSISILAPAKINLTLEVLGRRPDGFHALRSVMQVIALADRLTVEPADTLTLTCSLPELESAQNLVWRAAELLRRETGDRRRGEDAPAESHPGGSRPRGRQLRRRQRPAGPEPPVGPAPPPWPAAGAGRPPRL